MVNIVACVGVNLWWSGNILYGFVDGNPCPSAIPIKELNVIIRRFMFHSALSMCVNWGKRGGIQFALDHPLQISNPQIQYIHFPHPSASMYWWEWREEGYGQERELGSFPQLISEKRASSAKCQRLGAEGAFCCVRQW